jgi:hypothetical protein
MEQMSIKKARSIGLAVFILIIGLFSMRALVETLDSREAMVIQYPNGKLVAITEPGWYGQWFGTVQHYPLRSQFSFSSAKDQGSDKDESIAIRFNDGGHASVSGVISWEMPIGNDHLIKIHRKFGNPLAIEQQLVRTAIESATFTTGPLMSSTESAAEKRNDLQQYLQDQAKNGPYKTHSVSIKVLDPLSGVEKTVNAAEIVVDASGKPIRENASNVLEFGINLLPMTISGIKYEDAIEKQIAARQSAIQSVQQAQANALKAEQDAITVAKQGEAKAAEAKWVQETIKAQKVTEAQQQLEVATLNAKRDLDVATLAAKQAEQYKAQQVSIGQGNATKMQLEMQANGALDQKLQAWIEVNKSYATAISEYKGNWVPTYISGGSSNTGVASGANSLVELLTAKTAKDLALDLKIESK